MSKSMRIAAAVAATATIIAAAPAMAAPKTIKVSTSKTAMFKFKGIPATLTAGTYVFAYTNNSGVGHDLKVGTVSTPVFKKGTKTIKVTLKKGSKVKYLCTVSGHAGMGQKGTITVK